MKRIELWNGPAPDRLWLDPVQHGLGTGRPIDLVRERQHKFERGATGDRYRQIYATRASTVQIWDAEKKRFVDTPGYLAILRDTDGKPAQLLVFSFYETEPGRVQVAAHRVLSLPD